MNWLAHLFLSKQEIHFQLGNVLADFSKGKVWDGILPGTEAGFYTHQKIDTFTDKHQVHKISKDRLGGKGLLRSVAIDLTYDYFLTKHWNNFANVSLPDFLADFYSNAKMVVDEYPEAEKYFIQSIIHDNRLGKYGSLEGVKKAMQRVDSRLSERVLRRGRTLDYFEVVVDQYDNLEKDFLTFFPELHKYTREVISSIA